MTKKNIILYIDGEVFKFKKKNKKLEDCYLYYTDGRVFRLSQIRIIFFYFDSGK